MMLVSFLSLISTNSFSNELNFQDCTNLLGAGIYNQYLENYCNFNGGVGEKLKQLYSLGGCRSTVPQEVVDAMVKQVIEDSSSRMKSLGKKNSVKAIKMPTMLSLENDLVSNID